ncbi:hypothetical protein DM860_014838 [Cuscuta australis]|uniref:Uncharacterized protein n=1 Tax=Cuscuta australis TaxID=267555 RepID=A0A328DM90_9ASTE|nr:hypothetical protein DM860_014838 [Cuscuta australis]
MDNHLHQVVPPQFGKNKNHERKEPGELLDESWFFRNLFDRKPKMSRCHSDSSMLRGKSMEETFSSINRFGEGKTLLLLLSRDGGKGLQKTPSLPPIVTTIIKQDSDHKAETNEPIFPEPLRNNLLRAPSLPVFAGTEDDDDDVNVNVDDDDDESDFCMGKLIRQASLNQSKLLLRQTSFIHPRFLPPRQTPKGVIRSCNISTLGSKKPEPEIIASISGTDSEERKSNCVQNNLKTRKGHSGQDIDNDSQGFKNLGLNCHDKEKVTKRAYQNPSKAAWQRGKKLGPPPLHSGVAYRISTEDMKAQIKFWARAVASNVH